MEKLGDYVKQSVLNLKLELCCFFASVRVGVLAFTSLNVIIGCIILIALAEGNFAPLLLQALTSIGGDELNFVPTCIIAYAVELASSALLLCAIIREDLVLLRVYLYYALGVLMLAVMVYSVVFMALSYSLEFFIVGSVGYQIYLILLVRSAMVEIKQSSIKNSYTVSLRKNVEAYMPSLREKYSVVIETDGKKTPVASLVRKDVKADVNTEISVKPEFHKDATIPVHLAAREEIAKAGLAKEITPVHKITKEVIAKESTPTDGANKDGLTNEGANKDGIKQNVANEEVKKEEIKKPFHSFPVHLAVREEIPKAGHAKKTTPAYKITEKVIATESTSKDGANKEGPTNQGVNKDGVKENVVHKQVEKEQIKKPFRNFFGRKEKVKESRAKLDNIEESKKD